MKIGKGGGQGWNEAIQVSQWLRLATLEICATQNMARTKGNG